MNFIPFTNVTPAGNRIRGAMAQLESGLEGLQEITGSMALMVEGDGSLDTDYDKMAGVCGFADGASARAAFNELLSLKGKLTVDTQVSSVNAALLQAFNKLRY